MKSHISTSQNIKKLKENELETIRRESVIEMSTRRSVQSTSTFQYQQQVSHQPQPQQINAEVLHWNDMMAEKNHDILKVARDIEKLHEIQKEAAILINDQGLAIDNIEEHII